MDVLFEVAVFARHFTAVSRGFDCAQVCIVGNADELGAWDTSKALPLQLVDGSASEKKYAVTVHFPAAREWFPLEYKYIIKDTTTNEVVSWEAIPGNRTLTLTRVTNVALAKPSTQSSTYTTDRMPRPGGRPASLGNDGNHNGFYEWQCPRTTSEPNPWWSVNLGATVALRKLNLWMAMAYHEQPKRATACPPASAVTAGTSASALPAPPVWIIVSTEDLSGRSGEELLKLVLAPGYLTETIRAFQLELHDDSRVEHMDLGGVQARYVRIQYETPASALQFSELEVFTDGVATLDPAQPLKRVDGCYGLDPASDADLAEYVDSQWVDPLGNSALVRLWIGSFRKDVPAIQWYDGSSSTRPVHVAVRHQIQTRLDGSDRTKLETHDVSVDARGATLLDKDGGEFRESLAAYVHQTERDLTPYVNATGAKSVDEWLQRFTNTQLLGQDQLARLRSEATTRTFEDDETLLQYGERTRMAFFIVEGQVDVTGPPTVSGAIPLGSITSGSALNDLALFSSWPTRSASFIAKGRVVTHVLTYDALKNVVGEAQLRTLRQQLVRERHARDSTASTASDRQLLVVDADHAQVFRTKVPSTALESVNAASVHRLTFEFYEVAQVGASNHDKGVLLGVLPLMPNQLNPHGEGFITLPIVSNESGDLHVVGQVELHYLVVRPFVHARNNLSNVWRSYWRERPPQNGGHRGMGRHFNQVGGFRKALTRENTLASFLLAGKSGADFVEFDVQLTKDHIPVLYHDFIFHVGLEDKTAWSHGARAEQHAIAIHQLTLRELTRSQTSVVRQKLPPLLQRLIKKHWRTILGRSDAHGGADSTRPDPARGTVGLVECSDDHLVDFYPRLEDLLKHVPPEIALNIEIKYPDSFKRAAYRLSPSFAINYYLDTILQCVFDHAGPGRRLFFSCFDPDIVVALRAKQATYPVLFLTYGRVQPTFDARLGLQFAHSFARMEKLRGIVSNSDEFLTSPACAELIKRDGLVLLTWGDQNTSHESVQLQKRHAIDGIISDNIGDLTRQDRKLAAAKTTAL